jgi:uncharacterized protein
MTLPHRTSLVQKEATMSDPTRRLLLSLLLASLLTLGASSTAQTLTMGGGFTGGSFNVFVELIADRLSGALEDVTVEPVTSAGSIENLRRILAAELDMAVAFAGDAFAAFNGFEGFDDDEQDKSAVRAIGYLYPAVSQVVTLPSTGITTLADLAGKRLAVGDLGSGTHMAMHRLLITMGVARDVRFVFVGGQAASQMLKDGRIDAYHVLVGVPNATVADTSVDREIVLLDTLGPALVATFFDRYPFYIPIVIPGGTYRGVAADVPTFKDAGLWVVSADLDEELVYQMTKAVYGAEGLQHLHAAHANARDMGAKTALRGVAIPLHAGAARFWIEQGLQLPAIARP